MLKQRRLFLAVHVVMNLRSSALVKEQSDWGWSVVGESAARHPLVHRVLCDVRLPPYNTPI